MFYFKVFDGKKEYLLSLSQIKNSIKRGKATGVLTAKRQGSNRLIYVHLDGQIKMSLQFLGITKHLEVKGA